MVKFSRNYELTVTFENGTSVTLKPPLTLDIDIIRNVLTSANTCSMRIFNLSQINRNQIKKDSFDYGLKMQVTLKAGYDQNMPVIFKGNVYQAWSVRESVDYITEIQCFDGGLAFANSIFSGSPFPEGTENRDIVITLIKSMKPQDVDLGVVGAVPGMCTRQNSFGGNTIDLLNTLTKGKFFIDNGKGNVLQDEEYIAGDIPLVSSRTGLLGTPVRQNTFLTFDMIFEPKIVIGQKIKLESQTNKNFSGFYKVISAQHRGRFSEGVGGSVVTSAGLWAPKNLTGVGHE